MGYDTEGEIGVAEKCEYLELSSFDWLAGLNATGVDALPLVERSFFSFLKALPQRFIISLLQFVVIEAIGVAGKNAGIAFVLSGSADDSGCVFDGG